MFVLSNSHSWVQVIVDKIEDFRLIAIQHKPELDSAIELLEIFDMFSRTTMYLKHLPETNEHVLMLKLNVQNATYQTFR